MEYIHLQRQCCSLLQIVKMLWSPSTPEQQKIVALMRENLRYSLFMACWLPREGWDTYQHGFGTYYTWVRDYGSAYGGITFNLETRNAQHRGAASVVCQKECGSEASSSYKTALKNKFYRNWREQGI